MYLKHCLQKKKKKALNKDLLQIIKKIKLIY